MKLTPINVDLGETRGSVTFVTENAIRIKVTVDADEARTFIDQIGVTQEVTFTPTPKEADAK